MYCLFVNVLYYCHRVSTQLQLNTYHNKHQAAFLIMPAAYAVFTCIAKQHSDGAEMSLSCNFTVQV